MKKLVRLFFEMSKIALFVVGGGYAILAVADDVFGRKLKWLREGELLEHLPIFQMVPGLIAGNTAIYTGLKVAGRLGAVIALVAVALYAMMVLTMVGTDRAGDKARGRSFYGPWRVYDRELPSSDGRRRNQLRRQVRQ